MPSAPNSTMGRYGWLLVAALLGNSLLSRAQVQVPLAAATPAPAPAPAVQEASSAPEPVPYMLVSRCSPGTNGFISLPGLGGYQWTLQNLNASLEMDVVPTFKHAVHPFNETMGGVGYTRYNVSISLSNGLNDPSNTAIVGDDLIAGVHASACSPNMSWDDVLFPPQLLRVNQPTTTNSTVYYELVNYDAAQSTVVFNADRTPLACCNMVPVFPDFPQDWSATVETNNVWNGFTEVSRMLFSKTHNAVRLDIHAFENDTIVYHNVSAGQTTVVLPANETYPHGMCLTGPLQNGPNGGRGGLTFDDNSTELLTTGEYLGFHSPTVAPKFIPGHEIVRGIPCEVWKVHYPETPELEKSTNSSFDYYYYFPIDQWLVAFENYHRVLKQVVINGTYNGEHILQMNQFIDMRPRHTEAIMFNPCVVAPRGYNCNCTGFKHQWLGDLDAVVIDAHKSGWGTGPRGFTPRQGGPYTGFFFFGLVIGSLAGVLGMFLWYRKVVGVRPNDKFGHSTFRDTI